MKCKKLSLNAKTDKVTDISSMWAKSHVPFFTETLVFEATENQPLFCSLLFYSQFQTKTARFILCPGPWFFGIFHHLHCHSLTKFICYVYPSCDSNDYVEFFDYLSFWVEHILTHFSLAEISILWNSNVLYQLRVSFFFTNQFCEQPLNLLSSVT